MLSWNGSWLGVAAAALLLAVACLANAEQNGPASFNPDDLQLCYGKYALCAAAACQPIPKQKAAGGLPQEPTHALCECLVEYGHNMGLGDCDTRLPRTANGQVSAEGRYIMSTYSYALFGSHPLMQCPAGGDLTSCFSYSCIVDEHDPSKARCTCPIYRNSPVAFWTQGGQCDTSTCSSVLWQGGILNEQSINEKLQAGLGLPSQPQNSCPAAPNRSASH